MTASAWNRRPSAIDALGEGISHMREKLFPFNFGGWITLGFVSLLESCGLAKVGGQASGRKGSSSTFEDPTRILEAMFGWIAAHTLFFVGVLMFMMFVSLALAWLRSRTIFVYIDDVASGRFNLVEPWGRQGAHADSYFVLSLVVQGAAFILLVLIVGLGGFFVLWASAHDWGMRAVVLGTVPIIFIFLLAILAAALLDMALRDFVAPLQISRNLGAREAGGVFLSMFAANPGLLIGYALLKIVVGFGVGIVVAIVGCMTCCIGFLPLVNETLFQPIRYAERSWSLKLLAQMGDDLFVKMGPPAGGGTPPFESPSDALTGPIDLSQIDFETPLP